jgi:hypothetical protein
MKGRLKFYAPSGIWQQKNHGYIHNLSGQEIIHLAASNK